MNSMDTEDTRPRMWSGVASWIRVWRMLTLIMSAAPPMKRTAPDSQTLVDRPKVRVQTPNTATAANIHLPPCFTIGKRLRYRAISRAPAPNEARSRPKPTAPTCRMSAAKIGVSRATPASSTTIRSREMAPSTILVFQT